MKNKSVIIILLSISLFGQSFAQNKCGTIPSQAQIESLRNPNSIFNKRLKFLEQQKIEDVLNMKSVEYSNGQFIAAKNTQDSTNQFCHFRIIPVVAHIIRKGDGSGGLSKDSLEKSINRVNNHFSSLNLKFNLEVRYIDNEAIFNHVFDPELDTITNPNSTYDVLDVTTRNAYRQLNIYFVPITYGSWTYLPNANEKKQHIVMDNTQAKDESTLSHEIGHWFNLIHTHGPSNSLTNEWVNGDNCATAGDCICDTPADPNLSNSGNMDNQCNYIGTVLDINGDSFNPDTENIMSYASAECLDKFTPKQKMHMQASYLGMLDDRGYTFLLSNFKISHPEEGSREDNSSLIVVWTAKATEFTHDMAKVSLSIDGGLTYFEAIEVDNNGGTFLDVPEEVNTTDNAKVKVELIPSEDSECENIVMESGNFSIYCSNECTDSINLKSLSCNTNNSFICPKVNISANEGDSVLNLSLYKSWWKDPVNTFYPFIGNQFQSIIPISEYPGATSCIEGGWGNINRIIFQVEESGVYQFKRIKMQDTEPDPNIAILKNGYPSDNPCSGDYFIGSNIYSSASGTTTSDEFSVNLESCVGYVMITNSYNGWSFQINIAGEGAVYPQAIYQVGSYYTYVAIDKNINRIVEFNDESDFTNLPVGKYDIYGVSYDANTESSSNWIAYTIEELIACGHCVKFSYNFSELDIKCFGELGLGEGTCMNIDVVESCEIPATPDSYTYNSSSMLISNGAISINKDYNVGFYAQSEIILTPGFHAVAGSNFSAIIQTCESNLPEGAKQDNGDILNIQSSKNEKTHNYVSFDVFPNPSKDYINFSIGLDKEIKISLILVDSHGRNVNTLIDNNLKEGSFKTTHNVESLPSGIYYAILRTRKMVYHKKIILTE